MLSARMKAEQAQEVARKAAADAEIALSTARQYSPTHSQPGALKVSHAFVIYVIILPSKTPVIVYCLKHCKLKLHIVLFLLL